MNAEIEEERLFEDFSEAELSELLHFSKAYKFAKGHVLFEQGEQDDSVYIIKEGDIQLSAMNRDGEEVPFSVIGNGTVLGEIAFFDGKPRTTFATTLTELEAIVISKEDFQRLEQENPQLAIKTLREFGRILAGRLRLADEIIVEVVELE